MPISILLFFFLMFLRITFAACSGDDGALFLKFTPASSFVAALAPKIAAPASSASKLLNLEEE